MDPLNKSGCLPDKLQIQNVLLVIPMRAFRKKRIALERSLHRPRKLFERCSNKPNHARWVDQPHIGGPV